MGPGPGVPQVTPVLEIGGTHVTSALVDLGAAHVVPGTRQRIPLRHATTADALIDTFLRCADKVAATPAECWGVAIPGPFDYMKGIGLFSGVGKFEVLYGVDLRAALLGRLGARASNVVFINDAEAFLLGEGKAGAAVGHERAVALTLGTGVGSAFLRSGQIVDDDPAVPPEGRVDLLEINGRPLEEIVSRRAIRARYAGCGSPASSIDVHAIADRARSGDSDARQVFDEAFDGLGRALGPWLARFLPSVLVVGGSVSASWDLIRKPLWDGITATAPGLADRCELVRASRPEESALLGAACHASRSAVNHPDTS